MKVLIINSGSSSIKYQLYDMPQGSVLAKGIVQRIAESESEASQEAGDRRIVINERVPNYEQGLDIIGRMLTDPEKGAIAALTEIGACGHRVVYGGETIKGSVLIDDGIIKLIEEYSELAPLHNPPNLLGILAAKRMLGNIPQVGCFDTAFHQTLPEEAYLYSLPYELCQKMKIRRVGFHGTSHQYVTERAAELLKKDKHAVNLITCHLGNGCSMTAVRGGRSVDHTMGFTPLEGLVMGTRIGDLDPGIVLYLARRGYSISELDKMLFRQSGLLGISGTSNDVRDLEQRAAAGDARAKLALDVFCYRIRKYIGAYLAVLNGCDAIIFTAGIGEGSAMVRRRTLEKMEALGITLDIEKNNAIKGREGRIDADDSRIALFVIPTDEEIVMVRDTFALATGKTL